MQRIQSHGPKQLPACMLLCVEKGRNHVRAPSCQEPGTPFAPASLELFRIVCAHQLGPLRPKPMLMPFGHSLSAFLKELSLASHVIQGSLTTPESVKLIYAKDELSPNWLPKEHLYGLLLACMKQASLCAPTIWNFSRLLSASQALASRWDQEIIRYFFRHTYSTLANDFK